MLLAATPGPATLPSRPRGGSGFLALVSLDLCSTARAAATFRRRRRHLQLHALPRSEVLAPLLVSAALVHVHLLGRGDRVLFPKLAAHCHRLLGGKEVTLPLHLGCSLPGGGLQAVDKHVRLFLHLLKPLIIQQHDLVGVVGAVKPASEDAPSDSSEVAGVQGLSIMEEDPG